MKWPKWNDSKFAIFYTWIQKLKRHRISMKWKEEKQTFFCRVFTVRRSEMKLRCFLKNAKDVCCLIDDMRAAIADLKFLP